MFGKTFSLLGRAAAGVAIGGASLALMSLPAAADPFANAVREGLAQTQELAGYPIVAWGYR